MTKPGPKPSGSALTPAEKQKRYRDRQKELQRQNADRQAAFRERQKQKLEGLQNEVVALRAEVERLQGLLDECNGRKT